MNENVKGITLIALVITIIVLLILAGVTIATLVGDNGLLTRANQATIETEIANIAERINLINSNQNMDFILGNTEEETLSYLISQGMVNDKNIINTKKLLGTDTQYGKGSKNDIYKIEGNQVVYINEKGEQIAKRDVQLRTNDFITEWTVEANDTIVLPVGYQYTGDNNFLVNWGDGSPVENINDQEEILGTRPQHQYKEAGTYRITISGKCSYFTLSSIRTPYPEQVPKLTKLVSWGEIEAVSYDFYSATNLEGSIPEPNKKTFSKIKPDKFKYIFYECEKITSIPENLFANAPQATNFDTTFYKCYNLKNIPSKLFENNINVQSFDRTFGYCTSLTEIPKNLFVNATQATNFEKVFYRCEKIQSIPEDIFSQNQNITNLQYAFYGLDLITSVPKLWERTTPGLDGTGCFGSCDSLDMSGIEQSIRDTWFAYEP